MIFNWLQPEWDLNRNAAMKFAIIVLPDTPTNATMQLQMIADEFWKNDIFNVLLINVQSIDNINLYTFTPYTTTDCGASTLRRIHIESNEATSIFTKTFTDLHGCMLKVVTFDTKNSIEMKLHRNASGAIVDFSGLEGLLLKTLMERLHFQVQVIIPTGLWGNIYPNGSTDGALKVLHDRQVAFGLGLFHQSHQYNEYFDVSATYYATYFCFMVPPGRPYTSIEKLLRPFQTNVWHSILLVFASIVVMRLFSYQITGNRQWIESVCMEDFLRICLGVDCSRLPRTPLTKAFVMLLIFGTLILRTMYQSSLFHSLMTSHNCEPFKTIDELVDAKFTLYIPFSLSYIVDSMPNIRPA